MHFLVDAQLPPAMVRWLEAKGHTAEHVQDSRLLDAVDAAIWRYALSHNAIILTKDEDFSVRSITAPPGPPVVWIRIGNTATQVLLERLGALWPDIERALESGEKLIEVA